MDVKGDPSTAIDFQEFDLSGAGKERSRASESAAGRLASDNDDDDDDELQGDIERAQLLGSSDSERATSGSSLLSLAGWQRYFDISSGEVRRRCLYSMLPTGSGRSLYDRLLLKPDLYGPVWVCATLAVSIAVAGNAASYLQTVPHNNNNNNNNNSQQQQWHYDLHQLTVAAAVLYSYAWLVPVAMTAVLWWRQIRLGVSLVQLVCLYGYSLTVFVPASWVCASGLSPLQCSTVLLAFALSGGVLTQSVWRAITSSSSSGSSGELPSLEQPAAGGRVASGRRLAVPLVVTVLLLHLLLSAGFLMYFFHAAQPVSHLSATATATNSSNNSSSGANNGISRVQFVAPPAAVSAESLGTDATQPDRSAAVPLQRHERTSVRSQSGAGSGVPPIRLAIQSAPTANTTPTTVSVNETDQQQQQQQQQLRRQQQQQQQQQLRR